VLVDVRVPFAPFDFAQGDMGRIQVHERHIADRSARRCVKLLNLLADNV
jgi:hypothetical protein